MKEADLFVALRQRFPVDEYALFAQVPDGTGFQKDRTADAVAMSLWPSRGLEIHGFEIKVSRADWLKELATPAKAESIARFCDRWWVVVADAAHVHDGELPPTWGLLALKTSKLHQVKGAPKRESMPPTPLFLAGLLRAAQKHDPNPAAIEAARKAGFEAGKKAATDEADRALKRLRDEVTAELMVRRKFEEASGLSIGQYSAGRVGGAVQALLNGGASEVLAQLRRVRDTTRGIADDVERQLEQLAQADRIAQAQAIEGMPRGA